MVGFWENHNPTQGDRQGNDVGSNYRSAVFYNSDTQKTSALMTKDIYQKALTKAGLGEITTEIAALDTFYSAEEYHQDYLKKNPNGYCGIGGTQVKFPSGMNEDNASTQVFKPLDSIKLSRKEQLVVFEAEHCAFSGSMLDNRAKGAYVDPVIGETLFRSDSKFKSGTGWPSFFQPVEGAITLHDDREHGMNRVEVRSASSGIHLGHVFNDGPAPTGKRYCINSKVLRFVPDNIE